HVGGRHGGVPGRRRLPPVQWPRAGRGAHAPAFPQHVGSAMQTAIATVSLSGTLSEKLEAIAAGRFKGGAIFANDLLSVHGTQLDVRAMIEDLGLRAITFQPFRDFEGMPEPQRAKALARAERKFDVMQQLGSDLLLVCSNVSPEALGGIDRAAADF